MTSPTTQAREAVICAPIHTTKVVMIDGNWRRVPMVLTRAPKGWIEEPGKC